MYVYCACLEVSVYEYVCIPGGYAINAMEAWHAMEGAHFLLCKYVCMGESDRLCVGII